MNKDYLPFDSIVFAGGGSRCFWQLGFWHVASSMLKFRLKAVSGVSAGAAMACTALAQKEIEVLEQFKKATLANDKNIYIENILGKKPVFPHLNMYRNALLSAIDGDILTKLQNGPDVRVLMTKPPSWLGPYGAVLFGFSMYNLEKYLTNPLHPRFVKRFGFSPEIVSIRSCSTPSELADLILQSSCTPPFTPVMQRKGSTVLDGGLFDNVPVEALPPKINNPLVLLTRQYPVEDMPHNLGRTYVQPSKPIGIHKMDYTNPQGLQDAFDLGRFDAERELANWNYN